MDLADGYGGERGITRGKIAPSPFGAAGTAGVLRRFAACRTTDLIIEASNPVTDRDKKVPLGTFSYLAEREGFEPSIRCRIHTFQACAFDHSAISPGYSRLFP